jgi:hypothetical protein
VANAVAGRVLKFWPPGLPLISASVLLALPEHAA